ncbi:MAG: Mth938-like domain-containing protein [Burkholderiales bacterium]|nr:Mth938-like domain-containing protein [Burkholderiales bacterium]
MKLHLTAVAPGRNAFTGCGEGWFAVNGTRYASSAIVLPERVLAWQAQSFAALRAQDFDLVLAQAPEIVLLGTGPRQRFPHPSLTRALAAARIGLEVMDLAAACRTFNILAAEDRRVAAALLVA